MTVEEMRQFIDPFLDDTIIELRVAGTYWGPLNIKELRLTRVVAQPSEWEG